MGHGWRLSFPTASIEAVGVEYRLLGPLEALVDGRPVDLGAPRHRATLVLLLAQANAVARRSG